jgi:hypothetical protein
MSSSDKPTSRRRAGQRPDELLPGETAKQFRPVTKRPARRAAKESPDRRREMAARATPSFMTRKTPKSRNRTAAEAPSAVRRPTSARVEVESRPRRA